MKEYWVKKRESSWDRPNEDLLGVIAMIILFPVCVVVAPIAIVWALSEKVKETWNA